METLLTEITLDPLFYQARASDSPEHVCRKSDQAPKELENAFHGDAHDAERQQKQPHDGVENEDYQSQRPADDEQHAPDKETQHGIWKYALDFEKFLK
jgi:hypothetical protein